MFQLPLFQWAPINVRIERTIFKTLMKIITVNWKHVVFCSQVETGVLLVFIKRKKLCCSRTYKFGFCVFFHAIHVLITHISFYIAKDVRQNKYSVYKTTKLSAQQSLENPRVQPPITRDCDHNYTNHRYSIMSFVSIVSIL